jgi:hypothetical protein
MTPIEDLLRQALATTPTPPTATDPLGTLDRRVRRARRLLAVGAGVVAAGIAAAVVVPLTVGGGKSPNGISIVTPPTQSPSPPPPGTTLLTSPDALWVTEDSHGGQWLLRSQADGEYFLAQIGQDGRPGEGFVIPGPADYAVAGNNVVWVIGDGGAGQAVSRIFAVDTRTGHVSVRTFYPGQHLSFGAVLGDYLFVDVSDDSGDHVDLFYNDADAIKLFGSQLEPNHGSLLEPHAAEMVTSGGAVWVHAGDRLAELFVGERGLESLDSTEPWGTGPIFAPTLPRSAPNGVWAYDGSRLIALMPSALSSCVSCAEGDRVTVSGKPNAVVETHDGLYVSIPGAGLLYYSPDVLGSGETAVTASLPGVQVISMTADPVGGVDYVDDQGNLIHWQPVAR